MCRGMLDRERKRVEEKEEEEEREEEEEGGEVGREAEGEECWYCGMLVCELHIRH